MKLKGKILVFDKADENQNVIPSDCKIDIPEFVPVFWNFDRTKPLGVCHIVRENNFLTAEAKTYTELFAAAGISYSMFEHGKIGAGGYYDNVKSHCKNNNLTIIDECCLKAVGLTLAPSLIECNLEIMEYDTLDLDKKSVSKIIRIAMKNNDKCKTCEFEGQCFFSYVCLSDNYKYYLKRLL